MADLYYGNGECSIEGSEIRGVEIRYRGSITIEKKASDSFAMIHRDNGIIIFPIGDGFLNDLFSYNGTINIISAIATNNNEIVPCRIKRVMDYSELLTSNAEDLTVKSEDLNSTHQSVKVVTEYDGIIENQMSTGEFYLEDGSTYTGPYHVHTKDSSCMTGAEHNEESQDLYFKRIIDNVVVNRLVPTKNTKNSPPLAFLRKKNKKMVARKRGRKYIKRELNEEK